MEINMFNKLFTIICALLLISGVAYAEHKHDSFAHSECEHISMSSIQHADIDCDSTTDCSDCTRSIYLNIPKTFFRRVPVKVKDFIATHKDFFPVVLNFNSYMPVMLPAATNRISIHKHLSTVVIRS
jgi:hypothetical protein